MRGDSFSELLAAPMMDGVDRDKFQLYMNLKLKFQNYAPVFDRV
jgi:hypothetical protein